MWVERILTKWFHVMTRTSGEPNPEVLLPRSANMSLDPKVAASFVSVSSSL